jgi:TRAP-type C4-dicarboxylate transport system substrate-binding protein
MPKLHRRAFVRTAFIAPAAFGILRSRAQAAEFVFKYGNNVPETYPLNVRTREVAERIRTATGGRFDLRIYPAGQLGGDTDMLSQVRSGAIEFFTASGLVLSTLGWAATRPGESGTSAHLGVASKEFFVGRAADCW